MPCRHSDEDKIYNNANVPPYRLTSSLKKHVFYN